MDYIDFLRSKQVRTVSRGFSVPEGELCSAAFDWQRYIVSRALEKGKAALFEDCGLGKTLQQLVWADKLHELTGSPVMILAPLAVAPQTKLEGEKFGISVNICENDSDVVNGVNITNYEKIEKFDMSRFEAVLLYTDGIKLYGRARRGQADGFVLKGGTVNDKSIQRSPDTL